VIAGQDADELRGIDEELKHTKQNFQPESLIVEEVTKEYYPSAASPVPKSAPVD
jgi:hypothetical protein